VELGPHMITSKQGWRMGRPVEVSESDGLTQAELRLERCILAHDRLVQKTGARPAFVNDELKNEIDWAAQVSSVDRLARFRSPRGHITSALLPLAARLNDRRLQLPLPNA